MQTFLPYSDIKKSLACLDWHRLGKQRIEARQVYAAVKRVRGDTLEQLSVHDWERLEVTLQRRLRDEGKPRVGWTTHPCTVMWRNHAKALAYYGDLCILEWMSRGYRNTMPLLIRERDTIPLPEFIGDEEFHSSHRSNLLRKDTNYYGQFGWTESPDMEYKWPR